MWTSGQRRSSFIPPHWHILSAAALVCALLIGLEGWRTWQDRTIQIGEYKANSANLARSLSQQAHDTIRTADTALVNVVDTVEADGLAPDRLDHLRHLMVHDIATLPSIHSMLIFDAAGNWLANSYPGISRSYNNTDREYFLYHQSSKDRGIHIGRPIRNKIDGAWVIPVSRRVNTSTGDFAGLVLATISVDALQDIYQTFDVGQEGAIALFSSDGLLLARKPIDEALIGTSVAKGPAFQETLDGSPTKSFQYVSSLDHMTRLGSYHVVADFPLLVIVSYCLDEVLADWWADARLHIAVTLGVVLLVVCLGARLAQQIWDRQVAEHRYRLLADHSGDAIICVGMDGVRRYVSPAFATMTGWSIEENTGQEWAHFVHPEDHAAVRNIGQTLWASVDQAIATYRYVCKDGSHLWVEAHFALVPASRFAEAHFVATIRDISARKFAEGRLEAANRDLEVQARTDDLTGLANRRRFGEVLELEWRRSARNAMPLSLLMIDVDHLKTYNAHFGHQQGDQVLQGVAAAIAQFARRPGDLAARCGGEKIALVLADTDAFGAAEIAETVRATIQRLGIEHPGNQLASCVTVSIGIATVYPEHQGQGRGVSQEALVAAADAALYGAKQAGRNQVLTSLPWTPEPQHSNDAEAVAGSLEARIAG